MDYLHRRRKNGIGDLEGDGGGGDADGDVLGGDGDRRAGGEGGTDSRKVQYSSGFKKCFRWKGTLCWHIGTLRCMHFLLIILSIVCTLQCISTRINAHKEERVDVDKVKCLQGERE